MTARAAAGVVPAAERGATRIADRVVAKIAAQAAREALRARRNERGRPAAREGRDTREEGTIPSPGRGAAARAGVTVREHRARVRVSVELDYPSDIGAACGAVRRHVASRVRELTGMDVPDVAVAVERLHPVHLGGEALRRVQ